ncbi:PASTA domain-containing protein [Citroniella saccharovorans]|uniref:PASTA domain-containing protein n=2 Tax=Citroniella saccharovorans TaxID=2053367 RepID=A0AAW9MZ89_9FIRM|nr:PASTA domain-containing protein [Citroniella saccharovorans]MEB3429847.1 PASTA domain-containing protein [Citroniella saccharovorans]
MTENNLIGKVEVPDILNLKFKDARSILDSMHLSYDEHKGDSVISYQKPSAGFYVEEGSYIYIETNE